MPMPGKSMAHPPPGRYSPSTGAPFAQGDRAVTPARSARSRFRRRTLPIRAGSLHRLASDAAHLQRSEHQSRCPFGSGAPHAQAQALEAELHTDALEP